MTSINADVLFRYGDIGSGWEAGSAIKNPTFWGIRDADVVVYRDLFYSSGKKGVIHAASFASWELAAGALKDVKPLVIVHAESVQAIKELLKKFPTEEIRPTALSLVGEEAFGGTRLFSFKNMEYLGMAPYYIHRVAFRRGKVVVFITCDGIDEQQLLSYARNVDARLVEQAMQES